MFAGEVQRVRASVEDFDLFGREVTVTINNRDLLFQEISHWTVGWTGEPSDEQLDAAITQALDHFGPLSVVDLVVQLAQPPLPTWCTVPRARGRLELLETERWVRRINDGGEERWRLSRRRTAGAWVPSDLRVGAATRGARWRDVDADSPTSVRSAGYRLKALSQSG